MATWSSPFACTLIPFVSSPAGSADRSRSADRPGGAGEPGSHSAGRARRRERRSGRDWPSRAPRRRRSPRRPRLRERRPAHGGWRWPAGSTPRGSSERAGRPGWMRARHSASAAWMFPSPGQASLVHQRHLDRHPGPVPAPGGGWLRWAGGARGPDRGRPPPGAPPARWRDGARCARRAAGPGSGPPSRRRGGAGRGCTARCAPSRRTHFPVMPRWERKPWPESKPRSRSFPRRSARTSFPRSAPNVFRPPPGRCGCVRPRPR